MESAKNLASAITAILAPYVSSTELNRIFSDRVGEQATHVWDTLEAKFAGDAEAAQTLARFENDPETWRSILEALLVKELNQDPELASRLEEMLQAPQEPKADKGGQQKILRHVLSGDELKPPRNTDLADYIEALGGGLPGDETKPPR